MKKENHCVRPTLATSRVKSLSLVLLSLLFITSFAVLVSATTDTTVLSDPLPSWLQPIASALMLGDAWNIFIISLIIIIILISTFYNILDVTSIFDNTVVKLIISIGLGFLFVLTNLVNDFTVWMVAFAAGLGAFIVWAEIIISFALFFLINFTIFPKIKQWAVQRKSQAEEIAAATSAGQARAALKGLRILQKGFKEKNPR